MEPKTKNEKKQRQYKEQRKGDKTREQGIRTLNLDYQRGTQPPMDKNGILCMGSHRYI